MDNGQASTFGVYPDTPQYCVFTWMGTTCAGEHRENCGCPGQPGFRHRADCPCFDPPVMRDRPEKTCPMCTGTGKVQDFGVITLPPDIPDPHPERRLPGYCWKNWPPEHSDDCGCVNKGACGEIR
jgi:hypothetical protein